MNQSVPDRYVRSPLHLALDQSGRGPRMERVFAELTEMNAAAAAAAAADEATDYRRKRFAKRRSALRGAVPPSASVLRAERRRRAAAAEGEGKGNFQRTVAVVV